VTPPVAAPGGTNLSDVIRHWQLLRVKRHFLRHSDYLNTSTGLLCRLPAAQPEIPRMGGTVGGVVFLTLNILADST